MRLLLLTAVLVSLLLGCTEKKYSRRNINKKVIQENLLIKNDSVTVTELIYKTLSDEFDIKGFLRRYANKSRGEDSCVVMLTLTDKKNHFVFDTITVTSLFYSEDFFQNSQNVLSYSRKVNVDKKISDNYYGDIVIADLNFDNNDDVAIINDIGGNGGSFYSYFLQTKKKKFVLNKFLTDTMVYFPTKIERRESKLITYVHAGACCVGKHIYYFDKSNNSWKQINYELLNYEQVENSYRFKNNKLKYTE